MNTTDKVLRGIIYAGLFGSLFLPLFVTNSLFFPYITGKNFAFRIIVEIVFAIWLILLARKAEPAPKHSWVLMAVLGFVIVATLATIFGANPSRSFWSNYERMDGLVNYLHFFAYFLVLVSMFRTKQIWHWFLGTSIVAAGFSALIGCFQVAGLLSISQSAVRVDATFGNATYLAAYMLLHIFIAIYLALEPGIKKWLVWTYGILAVLFTFVLYHTATRGAALGLIGGLGLALVMSLWSMRGAARKWLYVGLAVIAIVVGGIFLARKSNFVNSSPSLSRLASISFSDPTTRARFVIWGMAIKGAVEHPLLGWGPENFNLVFNKYYDPRLHSQETWFDRAHDVFLDWLVATGILGLAAYLSIFAAILYILLGKHEGMTTYQRNILVGLFAGYFFHNIFVFDNLTSYLVFFTLAAYVHFVSSAVPSNIVAIKVSEFGSLLHRNWVKYSQLFVVLVPIALVFVLYIANVKPIQANRLMLKTLYPAGISTQRLADMKKVFALNTFGSMEAREQLVFMLTQIKATPGLDQTLMLQYLDLGYKEMLEQLKNLNNDAREQLFMGSYLQTFGKTSDALVNYQNALKLSPKKQIIMFAIDRVYLDQGKYDDAVKIAKQAYEEETSFARAKLEYVVTLVYAKHFDEASALLNTMFGTDLVIDPRLVQAYASAGKYDVITGIWEREVKDHPDNPNYLVALAATYYAGHRDADAIAILQRLAANFPDQKAQADYFIDGIRKGTLPRK